MKKQSEELPEFRQFIKSNKIDETRLSKTIKRDIKDYDNLNAGIQSMEAEKEAGTLDENDQRELDRLYETRKLYDADILKAVKRWFAHKDMYMEKAAKMAQGRSVGAKAKPIPPSTPPPAEEQPPAPLQVTPPAEEQPPAPPVEITPPAEEPPVITPEEVIDDQNDNKSSNILVGVLTVIGIGLLAALGIRQMRK